MPLQDLTPQLRTRLSRMERAVGWFVALATALLVAGFGYYLYSTAQRKGWFIKKITYQTSISSGAGLKEGDPVKLMGFEVGEITRIQPNDPYAYYNITVDFSIKAPNYGYLWSDSSVKVAAADLLGHRYLEVTKGKGGVPTVLETNKTTLGLLRRDSLLKRQHELSEQFTNRTELLQALNTDAHLNPTLYYEPLARSSVYWLEPDESPAVTERLEKLLNAVEAALPQVLSLTNQIALVLSNSVNLTSNLNIVAADARPAVSNLALVTAQLNQPGALGDWLLPTNLNANLVVLTENLGRSLDNLAGITSTLNQQVQANTNMLSAISRTVVDADNLVQGLKRHWLLRSAFKNESTNIPPATTALPLRSPKEKAEH
jgi:ABC-type transporter Mla subunit MlaD